MASDEGFREIQLKGKQLVFLFMATTIVAVVIFLCGVMVGRGVRNTTTATADTAAGPAPTGDLTAAPDAPAATRAAAPAATTPPPPEPAEETVPEGKAGASVPAAAAVPAGNVPGEPAGNGFALQVAALNEKDQAEAIARRLIGNGYAAYIVPPPATGGMFRVRIGKFKERREADAVIRRLRKEEHLEPWIVPPTR